MSPITLWLADYQLLAAALLLGVMFAIAALRQPAQRLAVAKSTLAALAALAILCALPGWSLIHLLGAPRAPTETIAAAPSDGLALAPSPATLAPPVAPGNPVNEPLNIQPSAPSEARAMPSQPINWTLWLITAYAAGSAVVTLWLITGALLAHRVRSQATPAPPELQALLQQLSSAEKRAPELLISPRITAPVALGLRRPTILLPPSALPLPPSQLLPILAHELAHLQHRDLHTLAATRLLLALLWPQPLYWLLRRTIRLDQETLADSAAADRAGRLDYAQQLLTWASSASTQRPPRLAGAVGLWEGPSQLKRRIAVLLNEQFNVMRSCSRRWRGGSLVAIALMAIGLSTVTFQPQAGVANEADGETVKVESPVTDNPESTTETAAAASASDAADQNPMLAHLGFRPTNNVTPNVIRGRCLDEANKPIADVEIELYRGKRPTGLQRLITQTKTNAAGEFEFRDVVDPKQSFPDGVVPPSYIPNTEMFAVIARQSGKVSREVQADDPYTYREGRAFDILMPPAASLSGIVRDGAGKPIVGARVSKQLASYGNSLIFSAETDAEGRFSIDDLAPFDLEAEKKRQEEERKATDAQLAAGADAVLSFSLAPRFTVVHPEFASARLPLSSVPGNVEASLSPGARLSGRVIFADGSPAAKATVQIKPSVPKQGNGDWGMVDYGKYDVERDYQVTVQTDAQGRFEADSLTPGKVDVWAELPGWLNAGIGEFEVKTGPAASLPDLTLTKGGVIRLQLIDDKTGRPIAVDEPLIANVSVIMKNKLGRQEAWPDRKKVSDQGVVEIASLPGTAQVMLQSIEAGAEPQWLPAASDWTAYPQAQVVDGQAVDAKIRVRKAPTPNTDSTNGIGALESSPKSDGEQAAVVTPTAEVTARKNELLRGIVREKNSVRGYCVDEHGKPLAGAKISLFDYRSSDHAGRPHVFRETLSDQRGYFSIDAAIDVEQAKLDGIPVDKPFDQANGWSPITINAHAPGRAASYDHIPTVLLVQDGDLRMFELRPGKSLSGRVTDAAGRPVEGVQVTAGGYLLSSVTTDANGNYEIRDLYPMDGTPGHQLTPVEFRHPDFALLKAGPATVPGTLDVTLQPGGTIEGRVEIQDGASIRPAANVDVMIARFAPLAPAETSSSRVLGTQYARIFDREWVRTNDAGEYRMQSLSPGDHGMTIVENELVTNGMAPITIKPQETATAPPIILTRGARIRVKLIDAETKQSIPFDKQTRGAANPILSSPTILSMQLRRELKPYGDFGEVNVAPGAYSLFVAIPEQRLTSVHDRLPTGDFPPYHEFKVEEGEDLEFVIPMRANSNGLTTPLRPSLPPGVVIEGLNEVSSAEAAPARDASVSSKPASETSHQSLGMATIQAVPINPPKHQPNALELHIVDENNQPLAGVEATLYSAASRTGDAKPIKTLATDAAGNVVFAAVVPSDQITKFEKMKAAGEFIGGSQESYLVALKRPGLATALVYQSAGELALAGGKRTIMLRPAVKLSGRVTDPEGKPVPNAVVTAGSWSGTRKIDGVNTATTDADGHYEFADRAAFNRAAARQENNFFSFTAATNSFATQQDPIAPEDPSASEVSTLVVTHPDFAVTWIEGGDVPGVTDVQMLPAASIAGRVVHDQTGAPAAGMTVRAMSEPTEAPQIKREGDVAYFPVPHTHSATTKTDEQGNYRLANLPAGTYNLWVGVESPLNEPIKLASRGVAGVVAAAGAEPTPAPDSLVGPPPTVTAQLVDAVTGQPLQIDGEVVAVPMALRADNPRLQAPSHQRIPISKDGTFSFHVLPGKFRLGVEVVEKPGTDYRVLYRSPDDFHNSGSVVDFNFGEGISIELPVYPMTKLEQFRSDHAKAYQLLEEKKFDEAIAAFNKMIAERPDAHDPLSGRSYANRLAGRYAEAIADAETLLQRFPDNSWSKHLLADLLASSPVEGTRDGKRALQFAEEVVAMAKANHSDSTSVARYLELVAAAHAELGDFAKAVAIQHEAIAQAAVDQKEGMETRLKLYQADKPFRREVPAPTTNAPTDKPADQGASKSTPIFPLITKAVQSPPPSPTMTHRAVAVPNPSAGLTQLESLDLKFPTDATWQLIPQPAAINLKAAATLGDAVD